MYFSGWAFYYSLQYRRGTHNPSFRSASERQNKLIKPIAGESDSNRANFQQALKAFTHCDDMQNNVSKIYAITEGGSMMKLRTITTPFFAILMLTLCSSVVFAANKKKPATQSKQSVSRTKPIEKEKPVAVITNLDSKGYYKEFRNMLLNMNKKSLSEYITKYPNSPYTRFSKANIAAIEEASEGFGKFFLVLKNNTRLNVKLETSQYVNEEQLQFNSTLVRVDPSTIAYVEFLSDTEELEVHVDYKQGINFKNVLNRSPRDITIYQRGDLPQTSNSTLLPSKRTNGMIKYKIAQNLASLASSDAADKFAMLDVLNKFDNKMDLDIYNMSSDDEKKVIASAIYDMAYLFFNGHIKWKPSSDYIITDIEQIIRDNDKIYLKDYSNAMRYLIDYATVSNNDVLILPSIHGKADYYPFVIMP
ncbi:hypothetical protein GPEL0_01f2699 [Geoanaerobacter pelophilus]|uniref:Uncharacterized protein n=2 Tax=Geoanaerobacter pelophilus TaxID=60036 RepID=A0ABQ0MJ81_9BACT|nr:hypothetical protein GPEL0_01f2699 [Geoanaerobacter pelophilus]